MRASKRNNAFGVFSSAVAAAVVLSATWTAGASGAAPRPSVAKLSPRHGSVRGGTQVTLTGRGFTHVQWVRFGSSLARIVRVPSSNRIVVKTPAHPPGLVAVRVATSAGSSATLRADRFRYLPAPVQITVGNSGGQTFVCARTTVGALECWGRDNTYGVLGNGTTTDSPTPVKVKGMTSGVRDVAAGFEVACAVTATGAAKCWGWEAYGGLGNGVDDVNKHSSTPSQVSGLTSGVRSVAVGSTNACAVTHARTVQCWGLDLAGQLGTNGPTGTESAVPVTIAGLSGVASVAVGDGFMCALTTAGAVLCWGANDDGRLGNGTSGGLYETPATVHGLSSGVRALSAGGSDACAVTGSGAAKCWGSNANGSLGDGNAQQSFSAVPVQVKGLRSGQAAVSAGAYHTNCAVSTGGGVKCWGYNYDGTLGNGNENDSPVPVGVRGLSRGVRAESESTYTGCALTTTARAKCWGYVPMRPYLSDIPLSLPWFN